MNPGYGLHVKIVVYPLCDLKLPELRRIVILFKSKWTARCLKMGPREYPETSVTNDQPTPRNVAAQRRPRSVNYILGVIVSVPMWKYVALIELL